MKKLKTDYVDLLLIHQPFGDYYGTYRAMEEAIKQAIGSSILFILMNLTPMFVAIAFAKSDGQKTVLKDMFWQRESISPYILAIGSVCIYYGVSFIMGNVSLTGGTIISVLVYMPWTILQGGLEECGWRWYFQPKLDIKSYILKMFLISIVWFLWHIPIYRLPWITAGSSNYLIFYLMILGNTFMFGTIKEYSKKGVDCRYIIKTPLIYTIFRQL